MPNENKQIVIIMGAISLIALVLLISAYFYLDSKQSERIAVYDTCYWDHFNHSFSISMPYEAEWVKEEQYGYFVDPNCLTEDDIDFLNLYCFFKVKELQIWRVPEDQYYLYF